MDKQCHHAFIDKPFYKTWFRKCFECSKILIWNPIAKCSGCKTYCHRRCIQPDDVVCFKPDKDVRSLCLSGSDVTVVEKHPENIVDVSCSENPELVEHRPFAMDDSDLEAGTGLQDQISEAIHDESVPEVGRNAKGARPSSGGMTSEKRRTPPLANEEAQGADELVSSLAHQSAEHISVKQREMEQKFRHAFVNKPFYKWFRKCTECSKRKLWDRIVKCSGCKTYRHRSCMQSNDDACCRLNSIESTARITNRDHNAVAIRVEADDPELNVHDPKVDTRPDEDVRDLNPADSDVVVVVERPENIVDVSCSENPKSVEQGPCAMNDYGLGDGTRLHDEISEAIHNERMPEVGQNAEGARPSDGITSDECSTPMANEKVQAADEPSSSPCPSPSNHKSERPVSECCWVNMDFPRSCWPTRTLLIHAKPIAGCSPFKLAPYRLPCTGTETDDERRKNDDSVKNINSNKYCGDGDQKNNMPEEKELD